MDSNATEPKDRYLLFGIGYLITWLILPIVIFVDWKNYRVFKTQSQKGILASLVLSLVYMISSACVLLWNYTGYDTTNAKRMEIYDKWTAANLIPMITSMGFINAVILERLIILQASEKRSKLMLFLQFANAIIRIGSILVLVLSLIVELGIRRRTMRLLAAGGNSIFTIACAFIVNFLVAWRVYRGSVQMVQDYHGKNNKNAKNLARRLFAIMILSFTSNFLGLAIYAFERHLPKGFIIIVPLFITSFFTFEAFYQSQVRKIYQSRHGYNTSGIHMETMI